MKVIALLLKYSFLLFKNLLTPVINNTSMEQSQQMGQMLALKYFEFKWNNSVAQFCKTKHKHQFILHELEKREQTDNRMICLLYRILYCMINLR